MKKGMGIICAVLCIVLVAGITLFVQEEKPEKKEIQWNNGLIEWNVDVTNDGKKDRITVDIMRFVDDDWGGRDNIQVYCGKTGKVIWSDFIADAHMSMRGVYLYQEDGKENMIKENKYSFDKYSPKASDEEEIKAFADEVNQSLEKSYVILGTNYTTPVYSRKDKKVEILMIRQKILMR